MFIDRGNDNLSNKWLLWYEHNRTAILTLLSKWKLNEGVHGYSCKQYTLAQYNFAFYYAYLIYIELSYGVNTTYEYYNTKYDIDGISKKLICNNIQLSKLFEIFEIEFTDTNPVYGKLEIIDTCTSIFVCTDTSQLN